MYSFSFWRCENATFEAPHNFDCFEFLKFFFLQIEASKSEAQTCIKLESEVSLSESAKPIKLFENYLLKLGQRPKRT